MIAALATVLLASISVTDDLGHRVQLAQPAQRIISLTPQATELLFEIGADAQIAATARFSNYPARAQALPRIGDAYALRRERVLSLAPDLALVWGSGTPRHQTEWLARQGIPIYHIESRRLDDIPATLMKLGRLTGTEQQATHRAKQLQQRIARLRERYANATPLKVVYLLWPRPPMTINGSHIISDALASCGASNEFARAKPLVPILRPEQLIAARPDAIIGSAPQINAWTTDATGNPTPLIPTNPDHLHRATSRLIDATEDLCRRLDTLRDRPATRPAF